MPSLIQEGTPFQCVYVYECIYTSSVRYVWVIQCTCIHVYGVYNMLNICVIQMHSTDAVRCRLEFSDCTYYPFYIGEQAHSSTKAPHALLSFWKLLVLLKLFPCRHMSYAVHLALVVMYSAEIPRKLTAMNLSLLSLRRFVLVHQSGILLRITGQCGRAGVVPSSPEPRRFMCARVCHV